MNFLFKQSDKDNYLVLDIGKEAIKALILRRQEKEFEVGAFALEYFDDHNFLGLQKEEITKKTISLILQKPEFKKTPRSVFLGLPTSVLKSRVASLTIQRKNFRELIREREKELLENEALAEAKEKVSDLIFEESGILQKDVRFLSSQILEIKIDGYSVPSLESFKGKDISFKVLVVFGLKIPLERIEKSIQSFKFKEVIILHSSQGLSGLKIAGLENSIFLEVGGEETQIFLIKNAQLEKIAELPIGGKTFSKDLALTLGQGERGARELKERYSKGELSMEVKNRVGEILASSQENWYKNLKETFLKINPSGLLPFKFYLFGGSSQLPEIQTILEKGEWQGISFTGTVEVRIFSLKDHYHYFNLQKESLSSIFLNNPQYIPSFLIFHARENF